ncbi:unnamed protein product [Rodentolepis nana]|uniref:G_PROTEIN_RECEP_F1_2 domain-containing protein n=1 Tax=Rodentolepis nana TaxID=102285 RepID=A0A0R3T1V8_RODNA|nr:unnamed protein product [Rodentolepis nana]
MTLMTSTMSEQVPATLIMLGLFSSIGCIGNTVVMVIYSTKKDRLTSTVFILALAMVDSFACVCLIPLTMYIESVEWRIRSEFLCKFYYVINNSFIPFSSLLISCIAFDRYFAICHPFSKIITVNRAKQIIVAMLLLTLLLGGVSSLAIVLEQDNHLNSTHPEYECTETRMLNNTTKAQMVIFYIVQGSQFSSFALCILSVVILYILIFRSVIIMRRKRTNLIGTKLHKMPLSIERTESNNVSVKETDANPTLEQCAVNTSEMLNTGDLENETKEMAEKNEQNLVSEIWKNRLNLAENPLNSFRQADVPSIVPLNDTPPMNNKVDKFKWFGLKKSKVARDLSRRISVRGFKANSVLQNMKTAGMLFVVAIVYIIALIPALLMAANVIHIYLPVFYMYYVNNAINPIIYCFMNPAFREDVQNFFISRFRNWRKAH